MERLRNLPCRPNGPEYVVERELAAKGQLYAFKYSVVGRDSFPTDMLRYDASFPADGESASQMIDTREPRTIVLRRLSANKDWLPCFERWRSFGWMVKTDV
jgi:hypothetical protein